jgi:hypothetical protein
MNRNQIRKVNPVLSKLALGYGVPQLVGHKLFPVVYVEIAAGKIIKFGKEAFTIVNSVRSPGSHTKAVTVGFSTENYSLSNHALDAQVPKEWLRDQSVVPHVNFQRSSVETVLQIEKNNLEYEQAKLATNPEVYATENKTSLSGTSKWTDYTNSDPIGDVKAGKEAIRKKTGMYPNQMIIPADVHVTLQEHPKMLDKMKFKDGEAAVLTTEHYQMIFGIDEVSIGQAALVGRDGAEFEDVWSSHVVMAYVPIAINSHAQMSYGYTYTLNPPGEPAHPNVEEYFWDRSTKSYLAGVEYERAPLLTGMDAGYLIQNAK